MRVEQRDFVRDDAVMIVRNFVLKLVSARWDLPLRWCVSFLRAQSCEQVRRQVQRVIEDEDCNRDCRDPSQNPKVSWALGMSRIAFARQQCEGSRPDVRVQGIGRMWMRP